MKKTYVWYSAATDVTGKKLAEALGADGGTTKPAAGYDSVICWGAKTSEPVKLNNKKVLNHPDNIRTNRNKLLALDKMKEAKCSVAAYSANHKDLVKAATDYPIIARTKFHQGGQGFWLCLNDQQVAQATLEGAQYFQKFVHIKDEYRLHIAGGNIIYAVKKVPRDNHKAAFKAHWLEHVKNFAAKKDLKLDDNTIDLVLDRMARKMAGTVDMVTRSNTRGWKFSKILIKNVPAKMGEEAIKAVKALGLDYGAVDCCVDVKNTPWIIECNSGPGLEGSSFAVWAAELKKLAAPAKKPAVKKAPVKKDAVAGNANKAAADMGEKVVIGKAAKLKAKAALFAQMLEAAGDDPVQLAAIEDMMG